MSNRIIKSVTKIYDAVATYWSSTRKYLWPDILPYLSKLNNGDTVLDIGCGNGRLLTGIDKKVEYIGVDISKNLLKEANKLHLSDSFLFGDITKDKVWKKLPQANAVFCVAVLHHFPFKRNHRMVMEKIYEKLTPGGFAYITVQNFFSDRFRKHHFHLRSLVAKLFCWRWLYMPFEKKHWRFMNALGKRYMVNLAKRSGLEVSEMYYSDKRKINVGVREGHNLVLVLKKSA